MVENYSFQKIQRQNGEFSRKKSVGGGGTIYWILIYWENVGLNNIYNFQNWEFGRHFYRKNTVHQNKNKFLFYEQNWVIYKRIYFFLYIHRWEKINRTILTVFQLYNIAVKQENLKLISQNSKKHNNNFNQILLKVMIKNKLITHLR